VPPAASRLRCRTGVKLEWSRFDMRRRIAARIGEPQLHTGAFAKKLASKEGPFSRQEWERDPVFEFLGTDVLIALLQVHSPLPIRPERRRRHAPSRRAALEKTTPIQKTFTLARM